MDSEISNLPFVICETETLRNNEVFEELLINSRNLDLSLALKYTLAAYMIRHSRVPLCDVMNSLAEIESGAAAMVDNFFQQALHSTDLKGSLRGAYSFISMTRKQT